MCKLLIIKGKVKEGYVMSVYKREMMGGIFLEGIFGILYGLVEFVE